jgi:RNA polymerase-binding transcription factor DksA
MNREDEICLALQGLINGVDYETGEVVEFGDKVKDSLKVIAATFECRERCQQISVISESEQSKVRDWNMVNGTFKEIIQTIKRDRPNHLVIIQNGYYYEVLNEDADFFVDRFSYNTFDWHGTTKTGFPIHSESVFSDLREMKQPFVLVSQLPKGEGKKVRRAISDVYDVEIKSVTRNCRKCGAEIPKRVIEEFQYREDCDSCRQKYLSKFGAILPEDNKYKPSKKNARKVDSNPGSRLCGDCGCPIPQARIDNVPGVVRCASCQSKFEVANPGSVARKVKESFGTRDDFKNMRSKQFGTNIHNKI